MAKMRLLAPKLQTLRERFGDDRMKLNQEMMALYKAEKVNQRLAVCLFYCRFRILRFIKCCL